MSRQLGLSPDLMVVKDGGACVCQAKCGVSGLRLVLRQAVLEHHWQCFVAVMVSRRGMVVYELAIGYSGNLYQNDQFLGVTP